MTSFDPRPIGIFDSGVGGLSVMRHLRAQLPGERLIYLADQANVPYGLRPAAEVLAFSAAITRFLLAQDAKLVVVACNTASAAALTALRQRFPEVAFVGMEPAVKPAAQRTQSGTVGVLATAGTFVSQRYASLMQRFAHHVEMLEDPCVGLVELIEAGKGEDAETAVLLRQILLPMLEAGVDTLVLGCTHYPFVIPQIQTVVGPDVAIIDPAPAVARQVGRVLAARQQLADGGAGGGGGGGEVALWTTGSAAAMAAMALRLVAFTGGVETAVWQHGELVPAPAVRRT